MFKQGIIPQLTLIIKILINPDSKFKLSLFLDPWKALVSSDTPLSAENFEEKKQFGFSMKYVPRSSPRERDGMLVSAPQFWFQSLIGFFITRIS